MSLNEYFRTDKSLELEGLKIEYADTEGDVLAWFKCRRPGGSNHEYPLLFSLKLREAEEDFKGMSDVQIEEAVRRIKAQVYADVIVMAWGGDIQGPDGKVMECSKENVYWLLAEDCPDLFDDLQARLNMISNWSADRLKKES